MAASISDRTSQSLTVDTCHEVLVRMERNQGAAGPSEPHYDRGGGDGQDWTIWAGFKHPPPGLRGQFLVMVALRKRKKWGCGGVSHGRGGQELADSDTFMYKHKNRFRACPLVHPPRGKANLVYSLRKICCYWT